MNQNLISNSLNLITGHISPNLGLCQNLRYFDASYNNLIGSIPSSIGGLKQLQMFDFSKNQLTGKPCEGQTNLSNYTILIHNQVENI